MLLVRGVGYGWGRKECILFQWPLTSMSAAQSGVRRDGQSRAVYVATSGETGLCRAVLGRWRGPDEELRAVSGWEDSPSHRWDPLSPTSSLRNLNLERKSCQTTYQPNNMKRKTHTRVATMTNTVSPTLCHILMFFLCQRMVLKLPTPSGLQPIAH